MAKEYRIRYGATRYYQTKESFTQQAKLWMPYIENRIKLGHDPKVYFEQREVGEWEEIDG